MNLTLIKYLIKLFIFNLIFSNFILADQFENWLLNKKEIILGNEIVKISFLSEFDSKSLQLNRKDSSYIILCPKKNIYQIKFLNNIVYYDNKKMDQYNNSSKQLFRYKSDKILVSVIDKLLSDKFFKRSKYKKINDFYYFDAISIGKKDSILINKDFNVIQYLNNEFSYEFYNINIEVLNQEMLEKELLYNIIDTSQVEIFNFIK